MAAPPPVSLLGYGIGRFWLKVLRANGLYLGSSIHISQGEETPGLRRIERSLRDQQHSSLHIYLSPRNLNFRNFHDLQTIPNQNTNNSVIEFIHQETAQYF